MERPPIANVATVDPDNVVVVRGSVAPIEEGADAHIDSLAKKYLGPDTYPMRQPGEVRVKYKVNTDNVVMRSGDDI